MAKIMRSILKQIKKKQTYNLMLVLVVFGLFNASSVFADDNCLCSSGGAIPGYYEKSGSFNLESDEDCKNQCKTISEAKYYSFSNIAKIGYSRIYNCLCVEGSYIPFYYPLNSKYDVINDDACHQQCANVGTKYYSYSNVANLGTERVTKAPQTSAPQVAGPAQTGSGGKFSYILLESLPGFFDAGATLTDFPKLVLSIYKFGIWIVGIAALFMIVVGGIMYMGSAGNKATAGSAKGIISDALIGVATALTAYLFLFVINPDLVKINLNLAPAQVFEHIDQSNPTGSTTCLNCISVEDICKESPCSLNRDLAFKLRAALKGQNARITEGWPATVNHSSSCHGNGTCADVNLTVNQGVVSEVKKLQDAIRSAGLHPVYESKDCDAYTNAGVYCKYYPTMTYPSFHVNM